MIIFIIGLIIGIFLGIALVIILGDPVGSLSNEEVQEIFKDQIKKENYD